MSKPLIALLSVLSFALLGLGAPARALAEEGADEEDYEEEGLELEEGGGHGGSGEYQLRGPESLATPEELLAGGSGGAEGDEEEDEEGGEEGAPTPDAEEVSLELDLGEEAGTEGGPLPPVHGVEPVEQARLRWFLIPPYYQGLRGGDGVRLFFPFYFQRWSSEGQRELAVLPFYYQSRGPGPEDAVDFGFPIFYWMRNAERRALVVGNVWVTRGQGSAHSGVAPLLAWGHTPELSYQVFFPLFYRFHWSDSREFWLAALAFNHTFDTGYRRGLFPIFWMLEQNGRGSLVTFPIVWHFWDRNEGSSTTVVPPAYVQLYRNGFGFGLAPLLFVEQRGGANRTTLFPLFHYRSEPNGDRTFGSPVAWYHRHADTSMGGVLLYHWMRGPRSRFDGFIPFYLSGEDRRVGSRWRFVFPLVFSSSSPVRRQTVLFPAVWDFEERHRSRTTVVLPFMVQHRHLYEDAGTTWVVPTFQYTRRTDGWDFNFHPLLYLSQGPDRSHQVVFPFFWRFQRPGSTSTVAFPLWWDFQSDGSRFQTFFPFYFRQTTRDGQWTSVLNVVYASGQRHGVPYWSLNVFPLFQVGRQAPEDIDWQVLLGLAGYGRHGEREWVDVFWVPVELGRGRDGEDEPAAEPAEDEGSSDDVALPTLDGRG